MVRKRDPTFLALSRRWRREDAASTLDHQKLSLPRHREYATTGMAHGQRGSPGAATPLRSHRASSGVNHMAAFVNPYNFVRSEYDAGKGAAPLAHDRLHVAHYSGRMACTLTTITRVTTKSFERQRGMCIYGSTLKGMVRAVAEAVAHGCFPLSDNVCQNAQ